MDDFEFVELLAQWVPGTPGYYPVVKRNGKWLIVRPKHDAAFGRLLLTSDRIKAADVVRFFRDKGEEATLIKMGADPVP
jgi:hypothetical protein